MDAQTWVALGGAVGGALAGSLGTSFGTALVLLGAERRQNAAIKLQLREMLRGVNDDIERHKASNKPFGVDWRSFDRFQDRLLSPESARALGPDLRYAVDLTRKIEDLRVREGEIVRNNAAGSGAILSSIKFTNERDEVLKVIDAALKVLAT